MVLRRRWGLGPFVVAAALSACRCGQAAAGAAISDGGRDGGGGDAGAVAKPDGGGRDGGIAPGRDGGWPAPGDGGCGLQTCQSVGANCGPVGDGCGDVLDCGACTAPQTCGGGGTPSVCGGHAGCVPRTCASAGAACGPIGDGCGGALDCGSCEAPATCGGGGTPSVCGITTAADGGTFAPDGGCLARGCTEQGIECGPAGDGCGGLLDCGGCDAGSCGGGGKLGRCGAPACTRRTCVEAGAGCGEVGDGCGGLIDCGGCAPPAFCGGGGVGNQCGVGPGALDAGWGCHASSDCASDRLCEGGACVPWSDGGFDPDCNHPALPAHFAPSIRCSWPPEVGGAYQAAPDPDHIQVMTTPLVASFGRGVADGGPVIVFPTQNSLNGGTDECVGTATAFGILRLLDPRTCALVATLDAPDQHVIGSSTPAIGDLDDDGIPEIVAAHVGGGLVAFHFDAVAGAWKTLWHSTNPDGTLSTLNAGSCEWAGPSMADVNSDGEPEILYGGVIHDRNGRITGQSLGMIPNNVGPGQIPVLANVDLDGGPELVTGDHVYTYSAAVHDWVLAPYWNPPQSLSDGFVAVARFGSFPLPGETDPGYPQIAVVGGGYVRVQTIDGRVVFGPYALPGSTGGGPPTIGDFNGDGQPDIAAAGSDSYTVFSFHCIPKGGVLPSDCEAPGILWSRPSQDHSSNITGSSLFDFTGAGTVDGIYADECFARVYDGRTGDVIYSQWHSSCTWYENPVVADVLGNYSSQLIVISNQNCGVDCSGSTVLDPQGRPVDKTFDGLHCVTSADCPTVTMPCEGGLCRCTTDDECCSVPGGCPAQGFVCAPPSPAGNPALGDTCRAIHGGAYPGVRVYADARDRWVDSRAIWNQHAYSVTNVNDDGTIPAASVAKNNWLVPGLNNFRENVQGALEPLAAADLTADFLPATCAGGVATLSARVCDRGAAGVPAGAAVVFSAGGGGCTTATRSPIGPGACETASCTWAGAPAAPVVVTVAVDPTNATNPCDGSGHASRGVLACCAPRSCAAQGYTCGEEGDGCGAPLDCGRCDAGICGGGGQPGVCGGACVPATCEMLGFNCGPAGDGCGGRLECGDCGDAGTCGGGGLPGRCGTGARCVKRGCADQGISCGPAGDGCGNPLDCGGCDAGTCGGGGQPGVCGSPACTPQTCAGLGYDCGLAGDGCGGRLDCGVCDAGTCGGGGQPNVCDTAGFH